MLREEGRPVTFRLALTEPDAFEVAGGPPSGFHRLVFIRRLPLDAHASELLSDGRHMRVKYGFDDEEPAGG